MNTKKISKLSNTLRLNKRGVSPIIATLLLVAIAVAASVITYTWAMSMTSNQAQKSQTGIKIDQVMFGQSGTADGISVTIRNTGSVAATIQRIYVFKGDAFLTETQSATLPTIATNSVTSVGLTTQAAWTTTSLLSGGVAVPAPTTTIESLTFSSTLAKNTPYQVTIITSTGFMATGTYYSPGNYAS